jgi:hypothetical protein
LAEIVNIDHETGDLTQYTSTVTDGGDLSVTGAAALVDANGLSCLLDDTTAIYGEKTFTQLTGTHSRLRFYIDPNGLTMADGDIFRICEMRDSANERGFVILNYTTADGYRIRSFYVDDSSTNRPTSYYVISDGRHYVEVWFERASTDVAVDGQMSLYIDGVLKESLASLDVFDLSQADRVRLGASAGIDAGTSGTLYLDDLIVRDDSTEIGGATTYSILADSPTLLKSLVGGGRAR